ncbi:MAG: DEAD/DEAH box helicase [Evtepia sp.]
MVLIEAPMGEGKTEAGIYAALQMARQWKKHGFYVGLPTSATSNQMVGRMREFLALHGLEDTVRLLHSMAWLVDEDLPEMQFDTEEKAYAARWLLPVRRGLLAPYAVGTVDQAMMAVLMVKYGVLRLLGLAQKTLVIDELHSYDVYMSELIERLLEWCKALEIPVVMLSRRCRRRKKRRCYHRTRRRSFRRTTRQSLPLQRMDGLLCVRLAERKTFCCVCFPLPDLTRPGTDRSEGRRTGAGRRLPVCIAQ